MTKITAHRGASCERPENTMSAYKRAISLNADEIEIDVHKLADGSLIISHDSDLRRCVKDSVNLYNLTGKEAKKLDAGSWFDEKYKDEKLPYFEEVLELLKDTNLELNVEIKKGTEFLYKVENDVVLLLKKYNMESRCIISSFDHYLLKNIKRSYPEFKVGTLYSSTFKYDIISYMLKWGFDAIHPYYKTVDKELVKKCHDNNILVNVWTVDEEDDIKHMLDIEVDSIITNNVALAKKIKGGV